MQPSAHTDHRSSNVDSIYRNSDAHPDHNVRCNSDDCGTCVKFCHINDRGIAYRGRQSHDDCHADSAGRR